MQELQYFGGDEGCAVRVRDVEDGETGISFTVSGRTCEFPVKLALEGRHFVADAMAAVSVGLALGVPPLRIQERLGMFRNMAGRQEIYQAGEYTIISDCYNAGPESMAAALLVLGRKKGRRIAVLGDMLELGDCSWAEHYRIGRIAAENTELVYAYGPTSGRVVGGAITGGMDPMKARSFETHEDMSRALKAVARPGDVLLFKGSHGMHMEKVLELFLKEEK